MKTSERISLATFARDMAKDPTERLGSARVLKAFSADHGNATAHPTKEDINECLFFSPGDGRIWLQDQRVVLLHTEALGALRRELIDSLGVARARGFFTRMGYVSGARDAQVVRAQWPDADPLSAALAGTRLHALEGAVKVEVVHVSYDPATGDYQGEFLWHHSSEDDEHIAAYGIGGSPSCWQLVGYATGYVSTLFGQLIVFRETLCRSMGDAHCAVLGKSVHQWDDIEDDMRYFNVKEFVDTAAYAMPPARRAELPDAQDAGDAMVGASSAFNAACHQLSRVAPTTATVLLTGESGVGKEKFARMLHKISPRKDHAFVAINCAAIPDTLIESELFGVDRGAYTGASQTRPGRFERAHGGTLFLDEIGTLSYVAQGKLLRALQEGEVEHVGGTRSIPVDVRVVAATNETLRQAVREGRFREDLFYRLNVFPIHLPPLRERRDDIPLLMNHFLSHYRQQHGRHTRGFTQAAVRALLQYAFPGNIRELQNLVERAVIMADHDGLIDVHHLFIGGETHSEDIMTLRMHGSSGTLNLENSAPLETPHTPSAAADSAVLTTLDDLERQTLQQAIAASRGNLSAAARLLQTTRPKLAYRARKHGLLSTTQD